MIIIRNLSKQQVPFPIKLPLWKGVVFVDWNGVMNRDVFWSSIRMKPNHPFYVRLNDACQKLFREKDDLVHRWMRGEIGSREIIQYLDIKLDRRCREDYLLKRLHEDCRSMSCEVPLIQELQKLKRNNFVVLGTDNMDCFLKELYSIHDLRATIDYVLCSSEIGVLKCENIKSFFGPWLKWHNLTFSEALLLDDSATNCLKFRQEGGSAVVVRSLEDAIKGLRTWQKPA